MMFGESHTNQRVHAGARNSSSLAGAIKLQGRLCRVDPLFFGLLRGLPDEKVRRDRGAEDGDQRCQKRAVPLQARQYQPLESPRPKALVPRRAR